MMSNFLAQMQELDLNDMWFQQDDVICHKAGITMDVLRDEINEHFIKVSGFVNRAI